MALVEPVPNSSAPPIARTGPALAALPLAYASVVVVLAYWAVDSSSPALTDLKDDLALSSTVAGLVFSFFFAGRLIGNFPAAHLVDRIGPAMTAAAGGVTLLTGAVIAMLALNAPMVLGARLLEGAGVALMVSAGLLSILRARPGGGAAMSLFTFVSTVGGVLGLTTGGWLTETLSWRSVFALHVVLGGMALLVTLWLRLRGRTPALEPLHQAPVVDVEPADRGVLITGLIANLLVFVNYSLFIVALPLYSDERFGATPEQISILLLTMTISHLVLAYPAGMLIRRHGAMPVLIIGNVAAVGGMLLMLSISDLWLLIAPLALYSLGQVCASNASGDFLLQQGGRGGKAVGMLRLSSDLGLVIGPLAVGIIADLAGYRSPFLFLPAITIAGTILTVARLRSARQRDLRTRLLVQHPSAEEGA
jgi:MFS family permease